MYTYMHNLQGDIVAILDAAGTMVVQYKYDAWGKPLSTTGSMADTLGELNPFRYRGYVYDETELYYLKSRYYSCEMNRFVSADSVEYLFASDNIINKNLFAYCYNNPIEFIDVNGTIGLWAMMLIGAGVNYLVTLISNAVAGEETSMFEGLMAAVSGAAGMLGIRWLDVGVTFFGSLALNYVEDGERKVDHYVEAIWDTAFSFVPTSEFGGSYKMNNFDALGYILDEELALVPSMLNSVYMEKILYGENSAYMEKILYGEKHCDKYGDAGKLREPKKET